MATKCPKCQTIYTDDSPECFCLSPDGVKDGIRTRPVSLDVLTYQELKQIKANTGCIRNFLIFWLILSIVLGFIGCMNMSVYGNPMGLNPYLH